MTTANETLVLCKMIQTENVMTDVSSDLTMPMTQTKSP